MTPHLKDGTFYFPVRVYYEDTDAGGIVYHANYLNFCERARTEWLRHLGSGRDWLREEHGVIFVVRRAIVGWRKPARLDDQLVIETSLISVGKVRMHMRQIVRRDDVELASIEIELVAIDKEKFVPVPLPESLMEKIPGIPVVEEKPRTT